MGRLTPVQTGRVHAEEGFTLVELMIVMAIVALGSAAVLLSIPGADADVRADATRFGARLIAARDQALFSGRTVAAIVDRDGYRFETRDEYGWRPLAAKPLSPARWDDTVAADMGGDDERRIAFDAVGLADESEIALSGG
ncbi:MAG: prepilin-type N-terminal cleavage/methylation domain-containing protein, partial [Pseudomonadota bacterium]